MSSRREWKKNVTATTTTECVLYQESRMVKRRKGRRGLNEGWRRRVVRYEATFRNREERVERADGSGGRVPGECK